MRIPIVMLLLLHGLPGPAPAADDPPKAEEKAKARRDYLHALYLADASTYAIYLDPAHRQKAELRREPAYVWTNPTREGGQDGDVFVWTYRGRPEAVGSIFSSPIGGPRRIYHEMHSLALAPLVVDRKGLAGWEPTRAGIDLKPIPGAPSPARTAGLRMAQMRALIREFSAFGTDRESGRWDLRVLAQPLYRYESTDPEILDGAVFTLVSNAGTDPELMIAIEARKDADRPVSAATWRYGVARFSDNVLEVKHKDIVVYTAAVFLFNGPPPDPTHRYHLIHDRTLAAGEEGAAATEAAGPGAKP